MAAGNLNDCCTVKVTCRRDVCVFYLRQDVRCETEFCPGLIRGEMM